MCGIVGAIAKRSVANILVDGLKRLEYRGYDSAGLAILNDNASLLLHKTQGKVSELERTLRDVSCSGQLGIAHTRWATHGEPHERNAHPHLSNDTIAIVHNGIIENHHQLRERLVGLGYTIASDTDSELIAHLIHYYSKEADGVVAAVRKAVADLKGAFALGVIDSQNPERLIAVRQGSPLVIGVGDGEHFIASDHLALLPVANQFIYLEEGDVADLRRDKVTIIDAAGEAVCRPIHTPDLHHETIDKGKFRHFMLKEIYDQPDAIAETLAGRLSSERVLEEAFGKNAPQIFDQVKSIKIIACGTSYHAGLITKYWMEEYGGVPCSVEIASEFRYRTSLVQQGTLFVTISQSGETADTLAALRMAKTQGFLASLAICNVPESSLVRESDLVLMTRAGVEIGVASTKAFTTQLTALLMLTAVIGRRHGFTDVAEQGLVAALEQLPKIVNQVISLDKTISEFAKPFADKNNALFLGRGTQYPVALEGALKLKEISYIHAEAYPAGELKHGPLALVDKEMPVITVAPNDELLEKLKSNLHEVRARGGELFVFADEAGQFAESDGVTIIQLPTVNKILAPIVYTIPLQLLAYHVALLKGTDVDQPRNLAKSVTVE